MFELTIPINGVDYLEEVKKNLLKELNDSKDYPALKMSYRKEALQLIDRIEVSHDRAFFNTIDVINSHLEDCRFFLAEEPFINNKNIQSILKAYDEIVQNHDKMVDIYEGIENLRYPLSEFQNLFFGFDKINPSSFNQYSIDLISGEEEKVNLPKLNKGFLLSNVRTLASITEAFYKDRVRFQALHEVLDFIPKPDNNEQKNFEPSRLSDEIKDRINTFAKGGREENYSACIAVLEGFEKKINIYKPVKKLSTILEEIKNNDDLSGIPNLPTDKTLREWINSYRTRYFPEKPWEEKKK